MGWRSMKMEMCILEILSKIRNTGKVSFIGSISRPQSKQMQSLSSTTQASGGATILMEKDRIKKLAVVSMMATSKMV